MTQEINEISTDIPVTTIVRHRVKEEAIKDFKNWLITIGNKAKKYNGFKGKYVVPPKKNDGEYIVVFQFDNIDNLTLWMESNDRLEEIEKLKELVVEEMELNYEEGIDFWFTTPEMKVQGPPKWKMAIITWIAVYPMVIALLYFYGALFPTLVLPLKVLLVTLTLVPLLTWVLMPNLTKLFKSWIFKNN